MRADPRLLAFALCGVVWCILVGPAPGAAPAYTEADHARKRFEKIGKLRTDPRTGAVTWIWVPGCDVTKEDLRLLRHFPRVKELIFGYPSPLPGSGLTDSTIKELYCLHDLEELYLCDTSVTEKGLAELAAFRKLR